MSMRRLSLEGGMSVNAPPANYDKSLSAKHGDLHEASHLHAIHKLCLKESATPFRTRKRGTHLPSRSTAHRDTCKSPGCSRTRESLSDPSSALRGHVFGSVCSSAKSRTGSLRTFAFLVAVERRRVAGTATRDARVVTSASRWILE